MKMSKNVVVTAAVVLVVVAAIMAAAARLMPAGDVVTPIPNHKGEMRPLPPVPEPGTMVKSADSVWGQASVASLQVIDVIVAREGDGCLDLVRTTLASCIAIAREAGREVVWHRDMHGKVTIYAPVVKKGEVWYLLYDKEGQKLVVKIPTTKAKTGTV